MTEKPRHLEMLDMHLVGHTFREIGAAYGVTRQRAEQIVRKAQRDGAREAAYRAGRTDGLLATAYLLFAHHTWKPAPEPPPIEKGTIWKRRSNKRIVRVQTVMGGYVWLRPVGEGVRSTCLAKTFRNHYLPVAPLLAPPDQVTDLPEETRKQARSSDSA